MSCPGQLAPWLISNLNSSLKFKVFRVNMTILNSCCRKCGLVTIPNICKALHNKSHVILPSSAGIKKRNLIE